MGRVIVDASLISEPQKRFFMARKKHIGYGGARGGGKSWAVQNKAKGLAWRYPGIKILIMRKTYPELINNHIAILRPQLLGIATYNDKDKVFRFNNGSTIHFHYCDKDKDLDRLQGTEFDIIFLDEATQFSEHQMKVITACCRGTNNFPKRIYYTCNPGGQGHAYIKRIFIDKNYVSGEDPNDYEFIQAYVQDNIALMQAQPDYIKQLEALPERLKQAWLYGKWDVFSGQFFEEFVDAPEKGMQWTHVINPLPLEAIRAMNIYRSYDYGYSKPFSCGYWGVDREGVIYRLLDFYGCTGEPNEGVKMTADRQFQKMAELEREHPYLQGKQISGVADPAIWDGQRGESIYEMAIKQGIFFTPGDNARISGWMQVHYRLAFDDNGYPMMYVFDNCKAFRRTIPTLMYDECKPEDLDTDGEDHVADEVRYFCMSRPIKPREKKINKPIEDDPLDMLKGV